MHTWPSRLVHPLRRLASGWLAVGLALRLAGAEPAVLTRLVEFVGQVETAPAGEAWSAARTNQALNIGDRVRTRANSRATLQLSDRSVVRIDQNTVLEIQPPSKAPAERRFRLDAGRIFFLNRERPSSVEFETPLAIGAIRGTEFLLAAAPSPGITTLQLFDGLVRLESGGETLDLSGGEAVELAPGQPPRRSPALAVAASVQWALYYPLVVAPADLELLPADRDRLRPSLEAYATGDAVAALDRAPEPSPELSPDARAYLAALRLAVGRVDDAGEILHDLPADRPAGRAVRELIEAVTRPESPAPGLPANASECLARSHAWQFRSNLKTARDLAREAVRLAPEFGPGWIRLAELEHAFGRHPAAESALRRGRELSGRYAPAVVLQGMLDLARRRPAAAADAFDQALALDASLPWAWVGRALVRAGRGDEPGARQDLQVAAALEPQRGVLRSYLGKAFAREGDPALAAKELRIARQLDPADPTAWLYSGLLRHQQNELNEAVRDLEGAAERNDQRAVFRSRLLLDQDRAVRNADLAAVYADVGLVEVGQRAAARAVDSAYAEAAGHLFLARSLQELSPAGAFDLRYETPRQNELLLANLLAPAGDGNLSQLLSQQRHLRFFDPPPVGFSSLSEYRSNGDWEQSATLFGALDHLGYALDVQHLDLRGQQPWSASEQTRVSLQLKQDLGPSDSLYLQAGGFHGQGGDIALRYDPASGTAGYRFDERQWPYLVAGLNHTWAPGSHTLLLVARVEDELTLEDPSPDILFVRQRDGGITRVQTDPFLALRQHSEFDLTSVDLQQVWETDQHGLIAGGRFQTGDAFTDAQLERSLQGPVTDQAEEAGFERLSAYGYYQWRPLARLHLTAGVAYDRLILPRNLDLPPVVGGEHEESLLQPKAGLVATPWKGGLLRAAYSQSLGGLYFDPSLRLEPTQLAGFVTAPRSLVPESAGGLVPGSRFETIGAGFDQQLAGPTYFGLSVERLTSEGNREVGALTNGSPLPIPDTPTTLEQTLDFEERSVGAYAQRLIGRDFTAGTRYRLSEATLTGRFPGVPPTAAGAEDLAQDERSLLSHLALFLLWNHPSGWFARWESDWWHQENSGYSPARAAEDFWQHHVYVGYRWRNRPVEARVGLLNLTDQDYRLSPLNLRPDLPRERMTTVSLRLNF